MIRNPADLYPTPACAAFALRDWLADHHPHQLRAGCWTDPAAGFGTLLEWTGIGRARRFGLELAGDDCPEQLYELRRRVPYENLQIDVNALAVDWPATNIEGNPPFSLLDGFVRRGVDHHDRTGRIVAFLMPIGFWNASGRRALRSPDWKLSLTWRPNFAAGYRPDGSEGSSPNQDYEWTVYDGTQPPGCTRWARLDRPRVPDELVAEHKRLARLGAGLGVEARA